MNRVSVIAGFVSLLNKSKNKNEEDPAYVTVEALLEELPAKDAYKFYEFFSTSSRYFQNGGFTTLYQLKQALVDFKEVVANELWVKYGVEEKSNMLYQKLNAIFMSVQKNTLVGTHTDIDIIKNAKIDKFKNTKTGNSLCDSEEQNIINSIGLIALYEKYKYDGSTILKEVIMVAYKTFYTKKFFTEMHEHKGDMLSESSTFENNQEISPLVVSLLDLGGFPRLN